MKKTKENTKKNIIRDLMFLLVIVYPLFLYGGYTSVTVSKVFAFGVIVLVEMLILIENQLAENKLLSDKLSLKDTWKKLSMIDRWFVLYLLANVLAFIFSVNKNAAFTGCTDSWIGLFYMLLIAGLYYIVVNTYERNDRFEIYVFIGGVCVIGFAILQFCGLDLFRLLAILQKEQRMNFLSTLGNTAVFGEFLVLFQPIIAYAYCKTEKNVKRILFAIGNAIGILGLIVANSDAAYLGFVVGNLIFISFVWEDKKRTLRWIEVLGMYIVSFWIGGIIYNLIPTVRPISTMTRFMIRQPWYIYVSMLSLFVIVYELVKRIANEKGLSIISVIFKIICAISVISGIGMFLYFSVINRNAELGKLSNYMRFSKQWGTERGYVWTWLGTIFANAPIGRKMIGYGQGSVVLVLLQFCGTEMKQSIDYIFNDAHNVYLNILTSTGVLGLVTYIGVLVSTIWSVRKQKGIYLGLLAALVAYLAQDMVAIYQPETLCLIWLIIAILSREGRDKSI